MGRPATQCESHVVESRGMSAAPKPNRSKVERFVSSRNPSTAEKFPRFPGAPQSRSSFRWGWTEASLVRSKSFSSMPVSYTHLGLLFQSCFAAFAAVSGRLVIQNQRSSGICSGVGMSAAPKPNRSKVERFVSSRNPSTCLLYTSHELMGLHDMFFDQTPNVLIHTDGYTGAAE